MRVLLFFAILAVAPAQPAGDVILHQTFRYDTEGWVFMGQGGAVRTRPDLTLALTYELGKQQMAMAVLPTAGRIAAMQRMRFAVKPDHNTALGVLLSEKKPGGGNYIALFWAHANEWQQVELTPGDFALSDSPTDPVDADGKLDLDQVEGVGIFDFALFTQGAKPEPIVVDKAEGSHALLLRDFEVLSSAPAPGGAKPEGIAIDAFDRGFLRWITPGGMEVGLVATAESPLKEPALRAAYDQIEGRHAALLRRTGAIDLSAARRLAFDVASEHETTLLISIECVQPGRAVRPRYNQTIFPPGGKRVFQVNLDLADFERDGSPGAGPEKIDPAQIKSITILDISATIAGVDGERNTIWLGNVRGLPK